MENDNKFNKNDSVFSKVVRAGRRRTYFFDVKTTRSNDYFLTITESKKRFDGDGYDRHKVFLYKEDFNKFVEALNDVVDHVKQELLPEYDFDEFSHDNEGDYEGGAGSQKKSDDFSSDTDSDEKPEDTNQQGDDSETEDDEPMKWD